MRSAVERFFAWLTAFRRITIRYKRLASNFLGLSYSINIPIIRLSKLTL